MYSRMIFPYGVDDVVGDEYSKQKYQRMIIRISLKVIMDGRMDDRLNQGSLLTELYYVLPPKFEFSRDKDVWSSDRSDIWQASWL